MNALTTSNSRGRHQINSRSLLPTRFPCLVSQSETRALQCKVEADAEDEDAGEGYCDGGVGVHGE